MNRIEQHKLMIAQVAEALGADLLPQVVFIGGCTTGLLVTDEFSREQIRFTSDVDLIVHIGNYGQFDALHRQLRTRGFKDSMVEGEPICALRLGSLRVDIMPDSNLLGFCNRWYQQAWVNAQAFPLTEALTIRLVTPVDFLATKFEAFRGRGGNDLLGSHDVEDIMALVDGRVELLAELDQADSDVVAFVAAEFRALRAHGDFEYLLQNTVLGAPGREAVLLERINTIADKGTSTS
jgi:predicted nucleotidyltransferase